MNTSKVWAWVILSTAKIVLLLSSFFIVKACEDFLRYDTYRTAVRVIAVLMTLHGVVELVKAARLMLKSRSTGLFFSAMHTAGEKSFNAVPQTTRKKHLYVAGMFFALGVAIRLAETNSYSSPLTVFLVMAGMFLVGGLFQYFIFAKSS